MAEEPLAPPPQATVSIRVLTRVVILLVAAWNSVAGLVLVAFHGASSGALGAGVEDEAGQRLLGVHLLILVPAYLLIAWKPERYQGFQWLPYAGQVGATVVVAYNLLSGDTKVSDGILALAIGVIFVVLLSFLWITEQRTLARLQMEAQEQERLQAENRPSAASEPQG
jgi:hypothetical protein